jgi:lipopolysaccharide transport system ATP-binding protein
MYVRLAFAVAAHLEPEVLLIDEVLAVGDAEFQRRSLGRMEELSGAGRTVLFVSHNMQAVSQLCDRVILLERGRAVQEGPAADVVASYLQRAAGAGASRAWPDDETAPGDQIVRLRSARVVDAHLQVSNSVDVRESVGIEIGFSVLRAGEPVFPKIKLRTARGETAFNAIDTSPRWRESTPPGEYVSTAWLPANFLNEGLHYVDVHVCSAGMTKLYPHAGSANALSFHVYDPSEGDSARGPFLGQWKGVVRPLLEWTTEER